MQTAGSGPGSPSTALFVTLPVTASGHPGNLGLLLCSSRNSSMGRADESAMLEQDTHYVLVIHGTFDKPEVGQTKWYESDPHNPTNFCTRLERRLEGSVLEGAVWRACSDVHWPISWSGENDDEHRREAGRKLFECISQISKSDPTARIHIIAHSHGGNVVLHAVERYLCHLSVEAETITERTAAAIFSGSDANPLKTGVTTHFGRYAADVHSQRQDPLERLEKKLRAMHYDYEHQPVRIFLRGVRHKFRRQHKRRRPELEKDRVKRAHDWAWSASRKCDEFIESWATSSSSNRLGHLIFLGTPFFYKIWRSRSNRRRVTIRWLVKFSLALPFYFAALYIQVLPYGWILSLFTWFEWNPLEWPTLLQIGFIAFLIFVSATAASERLQVDTNVYFDEAGVLRWLRRSKGSQAAFLDALVINAGRLDEALVALSSEPIVYATLLPEVRNLFFPRVRWNPPTKPVGLQDSPIVWVERGLQTLWLWTRNAFYFLTWVPLWLMRRIMIRYLTDMLVKIVSASAFGLAPHEFSEAHVEIRDRIGIRSVFREDVRNVAKQILEEPSTTAPLRKGSDRKASISASRPEERYAFLWEEETLKRKSETSWLWKRVSLELDGALRRYPPEDRKTLASELKCTCVAIEERIKEVIGAVELNHSTYYTNSKVIDAIAQFLKK